MTDYNQDKMEAVLAGYHQRLEVLAKSTSPFAQGIAWVEGEIVPLAEARVPLIDQGFLHSDLTYDVPAVWDGRYFRLDDHLARLEASCQKMRYEPPISYAEIRQTLIDLVAKSGIRDAFVQVIVTRGPDFVRYYKTARNAVYMFAQPYVWGLREECQIPGGSAIVTRTVRRTPPGAMDPTVKNLQWGDFTRGVLECVDRGATFPLLSDGDGGMTEGAGYNIFAVKDGVVMTPERGVLEGVTRRSVLELAAARQIATKVGYVPVETFYQADEIFLSTTAGGIMPIVSLDGQPVGDGKVGRLTTLLRDAYWEAHYDPRYSFAVDYED